jgi:hypothetical protein
MVRLDDSLDLPQIPVIDCGREGPLHLARKLAGRIGSMLDSAERLYTRPLLNVIDRRSVAWLGRNSTPYAGEIREIAGLAGRPGVSALNVSYEWSCTSGARDGVLWRSLDWPFDGLGANVVVARCQGRSGPWFNVTWPGFVGALTALKPGRFAAALNQAPLRRVTGLLPVDWLVDRLKVDRTPMPPPTHVLRQAFEECEDYGAAFAFLKEAPLALPALFLLAGMGGVAIIERQNEGHHPPGTAPSPITGSRQPGAAARAGKARNSAALLGRTRPANGRWLRLADPANPQPQDKARRDARHGQARQSWG